MHTIQQGGRPIHIWTDYVEESAMQQLRDLSTLDFLHPHGVAVMPDVHCGIGSTVGTVIATRKAIIPAAVGVDIGCGMNAVRTSLRASDLPESLASLRTSIERRVPMGAGQGHRDASTLPFFSILEDILKQHPKIESRGNGLKDAMTQLGSLGGGNHFIEICIDEEQFVWIMLHSGSRGIGNKIGRYFIDKAKEQMVMWGIKLAHRDLAYLPQGDPLFGAYWEAVQWAQQYAKQNRVDMMRNVIKALEFEPGIPPHTITDEAINCHHNYVELEHHYGQDVFVTRKGAIRARENDLGIIPGSMGQRSYIVRGRGEAASYSSCSHGAGRRMSRSAAKSQYSVDDLVAQTAGVECRKDQGVVDEIPGAYKNLDEVMANQADLVEIVHTLKAVLCCKGN